MTTNAFQALVVDRVIAIVPVGAIEQHGPHLPVAVDSCVLQAIVNRLIDALPDDIPATFLPLLPVGKSNEHMGFPGTLTLSAETLIRLWTEIGESIARSGIRKMMLLNSHGGQTQIMDIVARDLRARLNMFVVTANYWGVGMPADLFPAAEDLHGIHGGSAETSLMMYLRPDLVQDEKRDNFVPTSVPMSQLYRHLRPEGAGIGFGWQTQDLHPTGACGNALDADASRGKMIIDRCVEGLIELLREVDRFPLTALIAAPLPSQNKRD